MKPRYRDHAEEIDDLIRWRKHRDRSIEDVLTEMQTATGEELNAEVRAELQADLIKRDIPEQL